MKFKNKHTGVILEPKSDMVVEQLQKSPDFEPYDEKADQGSGKNLMKMKKDDLLAMAQEAGIEVPEGATKEQIVDLIEAAKAE